MCACAGARARVCAAFRVVAMGFIWLGTRSDVLKLGSEAGADHGCRKGPLIATLPHPLFWRRNSTDDDVTLAECGLDGYDYCFFKSVEDEPPEIEGYLLKQDQFALRKVSRWRDA